ncbi:dipeptidase [Shewanella surugensis]|uniref:Dipeptidase n=1 Tax=Shewanella surugensis TaxID=212020 RepID=A0ABT0LF28_9GAMM|nr:dipeptidase [Shewanella surugensis]MCL1126260.1 dipeptidase [Shewanella surugensis]
MLSLTACQSQPDANEIARENSAKANEIAQKTIIADTHIDVPYRLDDSFEDVSQHTEKGDFDYPRAVSGGLNAPFMSIYTPASLEGTGQSKVLADQLIDVVEALVKASPDKFALAYSTDEVQDNVKNGLISFPMGMENGSPIEGDLANLSHFYERGVRYITLAHAKANHISDSSYDTKRPAHGLTEFGKVLVQEMNKLGVMIDVSHISDEAFYQVMAISQTPVIASHSSVRYFTPGFERNMNDDMIRLLAEKGGIIQINFGSTFISQQSIENYEAYTKAETAFMEAHQVAEDSEELKAFSSDYRQRIPFEFATLNDVLDHFDHVIKLVGVEHVGIGSDFDGVGDSLPEGLKDVAAYPNLIAGFLNRGYSEADIEKILSGNLLRVWKQVEDYAASH